MIQVSQGGDEDEGPFDQGDEDVPAIDREPSEGLIYSIASLCFDMVSTLAD